MNTFDTLTVKAFLKAIAQQDRPLSDPLQQSLHQMGQRLAGQQLTTLEELRQLLEQDDQLKGTYNAAYQQLQQQYAAQERTKSIALNAGGSNLDWDYFLLQVLNADNPASMAQGLVKKFDQPASGGLAASRFWQIGDRVVALGTGGAAIGAIVAQIPGAIAGGIAAGLFAWFTASRVRPDQEAS